MAKDYKPEQYYHTNENGQHVCVVCGTIYTNGTAGIHKAKTCCASAKPYTQLIKEIMSIDNELRPGPNKGKPHKRNSPKEPDRWGHYSCSKADKTKVNYNQAINSILLRATDSEYQLNELENIYPTLL